MSREDSAATWLVYRVTKGGVLKSGTLGKKNLCLTKGRFTRGVEPYMGRKKCKGPLDKIGSFLVPRRPIILQELLPSFGPMYDLSPM